MLKSMLLFFGLSFCLHAQAADPELVIRFPDVTRTFSRSELLKSPDLQEVIVEHDPAHHGKPFTYKAAVPAAPLFKDLTLPEGTRLQFICLDKYSAVIDFNKMIKGAPDGSQAFIAIETEDSSWGPVKADSSATAGPFYLIWKDAKELNGFEWPYQLEGFKVFEE